MSKNPEFLGVFNFGAWTDVTDCYGLLRGFGYFWLQVGYKLTWKAEVILDSNKAIYGSFLCECVD